STIHDLVTKFETTGSVQNKKHSLPRSNKLKNNIRNEIRNLTVPELQRVNLNVFTR
ncbi:hypothetical protein L9F63_014756, partial [Diploptera punctata]